MFLPYRSSIKYPLRSDGTIVRRGVARVAEPTGIRGWRVEDIPADELAIVTENVTITNGAYLVTGANTTGIVSVVSSGGDNIVEYEYESAMGDGGISPEQAEVFPRAEGPELRFWIVPRANVWVCISNIVCRRVAFGDAPVENDLLRTRYAFRDNLGTWELGNLREWTKHLYDGNRGQDWAAYSAKRHVNLNKKALMFDGADRYSLVEDSATNLVLMAGGYSAMTVSFRGANVSSSGFTITGFSISGGTATITYFADIDGFDQSGIGVIVSDTIDSSALWTHLSSGEFTVSGNTVTIPNNTGAMRFYRLTYGNLVTDLLEVRFAARVVIDDSLVIRGSGASTNKYYRISVDGGTISASEVTL